MSEKLRTNRRASKAIAAMTAVLALAGCMDGGKPKAAADGLHVSTQAAPPIPLERCYDQPQKLPAKPVAPQAPPADASNAAWDKFTQDENAYEQTISPPSMQIKIDSRGFLEGDSYYKNDAIHEKVVGATVKIGHDNITGSGFITKDKQNREVIITAAHVVNVADLTKVKVTDSAGHSANAVSGCYMYEGTQGNLADLNEDKPVPTDVAVLRLSADIGSSTLQLASQPAARGQDILFHNYQLDADPASPYDYAGVSTGYNYSTMGIDAITGVDPSQRSDGHSYTLQPGASGGPVVDPETGDVVDISVSGTKQTSGGVTYMSADLVKVLYNADIECTKTDAPNEIWQPCDLGDASSVLPVHAGLVDPNRLLQAVESPNY